MVSGSGGAVRTMASAAAMVPRHRLPDSGSASTGQPSVRPVPATRRDRALATAPPTMMIPRPRSGSSSSAGRGAVGSSAHDDRGARAGRERRRRPVSGSRNARLRWTGPGPVGSVHRLGEGPDGQGSPRGLLALDGYAGRRRPTGGRGEEPAWSMVCGAPVSCSSGGRSAVQTISGTRAWCASTTAGCSSAAAVPLVTQMTVGRPVAMAEPQGEEGGAALVEPDVDPQTARPAPAPAASSASRGRRRHR